MFTLRSDAEHGQAVAVGRGGVALHLDLLRQRAVTKVAGQCPVQETGIARKLKHHPPIITGSIIRELRVQDAV